MLRLILGKDWTANREEILRRISGDVRQRLGGRVLIVPELISHDTERRLCAAAGDTVSRFAEVLSFTRLARRVADSIGSAAEVCLDNGGRVVAMAAAARQLYSRLKAYAAVETRPEFLTGLVDMVDEFKRCCITPADLENAAHRTEGSLAQKLEELSLLLSAYDSLCARGKKDPRDQMTWLLEQLEAGDFGENHVFYIDGFPDFTRQHMAILEHLLEVSPCVTVSLNCDRVDSAQMAFEKAGQTAGNLLRFARRAGIEVQIYTVQTEPGELDLVRDRLFQGNLEHHPELAGKLRLRRTESVYQECVAAAEQVMALVREGARYRQISVVCTDMDTYQDLLRQVFQRCHIPLYQSGTEEVLRRCVISALLSALDAALNGFERDDVLRYLKSVLSPLDIDTCDALENYAVLWNISGSRWRQAWEFHPDGLGAVWTAESEDRLSRLNEARVTGLQPLFRMVESFRLAKTLAGQVRALYDFFTEVHLAGRLNTLAEALEAEGDSRGAQILNQLWEILLTALEQLHDVLGETVWDTATFDRLFTLLLDQYDVGTIPPVLDAVTAGPVSAMRCQQPDHLILLGALEGQLPKYSGSQGILSDQERAALRKLGVPLTGGAMEGLQAEFAEIYGVFCGARRSVTLSCPAGQPSYLYRRLLELAGDEEKAGPMLGASLADPLEAGAYLARWNAGLEAEKLGVLPGFTDAMQRGAYALGTVSPEHIRALYGSKLRLSASQVDKLAGCRLSYFLKYGLRAEERKQATVDPTEFGTFVHAVLEQTGRKVMELGGFHRVDAEQTMAIAMDFADKYAKARFSQLDSQRHQYLFQRNTQELKMVVRELWSELSASAFEPAGFEVGFGEGRQLPAVPINGGKMEAELRGAVDRVDTWQDSGIQYFRVVDYKTNKKEKDIDYCDLSVGMGLQMLLYLFVLEQEGGSVLGKHSYPAGVLYFPARALPVSVKESISAEEAEQTREKAWERRGIFLADETVLAAMEPEGAPRRLHYTKNKSGALSGDLADREQFRLLERYIFQTLGKMVDEIASGKVDPNPYVRGSSYNACRFCPFSPVCREAAAPGRRNYSAISASQFWEEIGKELSNRG